MKTLGQVIREWRKQQGLSQVELAAQTNVPREHIQALEAEQAGTLPAPVYVQGYLQLIAEVCQQNVETLLALYRRDILPLQLNRQRPAPSPRRRWPHLLPRLTPRQWSITGLVIVAGGAAALLIWQWRLLAQPPRLVMIEPANYATLSSPLTIRGQTNKGTAITINTEAIPVDDSGNFSTSLSLPAGERTLVIVAADNHGRRSQTIIFVTIE